MNGKVMESRIITEMSIGLKGTKLLSIDAIDRSFLMAMKTIGKRLKNMHYIFNRVKEQVQKRFIGQIQEIMITTKTSSNVQIMKL